MNNRAIFKVALKYLGIVLGLDAFNKFLQLIILFTRHLPDQFFIAQTLSETSPLYIPIQIFLLIFYSIGCWYLLNRTDLLTEKFLKTKENTGITKEIFLELTILFNGIGLFTYSFPRLLINIIQQVFLSRTIWDLISWIFSNPSSIISILGLFLSFIFIFRTKMLTNWLIKKIPNKFWQ